MSNITGNTLAGYAAALIAPLFMTVGFLIWDIHWQQHKGSAFALNLYKCNLASIGFVIATITLGFHKTVEGGGSAETTITTVQSIGFLVLSSTLGILLGDSAWLEAFRLLGATRVLVVDTLKPFAAAMLGWIFLGEELRVTAFAGIVLTAGGVLMVALEQDRDPADVVVEGDRDDDDDGNAEEDGRDENMTEEKEQSLSTKPKTLSQNNWKRRDKQRGYFLAICNVFFDAYGSLLTKKYGGGMTTWAINLIRFGFAGIVMLLLSITMRLHHRHLNNPKQSAAIIPADSDSIPWYKLPDMTYKTWCQVSLGVGLVTFLCPALSNYALFQIALALAITLGSVTPLYSLMLEWPLKGNKPTLRGYVGTILSIAGVAVLCILG